MIKNYPEQIFLIINWISEIIEKNRYYQLSI